MPCRTISWVEFVEELIQYVNVFVSINRVIHKRTRVNECFNMPFKFSQFTYFKPWQLPLQCFQFILCPNKCHTHIKSIAIQWKFKHFLHTHKSFSIIHNSTYRLGIGMFFFISTLSLPRSLPQPLFEWLRVCKLLRSTTYTSPFKLKITIWTIAYF